jgi:hypothetical protein
MSQPNIFLSEIAKYNYVGELRLQERAASELLQKVVLAGLSTTDFFERASFHGDTALRIFHNLLRYSQDLDFSLIDQNEKFQWTEYLRHVRQNSSRFGCELEIYDKSFRQSPVVTAEVRDLSIAGKIGFYWAVRKEHPKKIMVKLELDTNVPPGGGSIMRPLDFPVPSQIRVDDLPTLCAGKYAACLCRYLPDRVKGRDWFDFLWYMNEGIEPNYTHLSARLNAGGPWKGQNITVTRKWLEDAMRGQIESLDIDMVKDDIIRFVFPENLDMISRWTADTFFSAIDAFHRKCLRRDNRRPHENGLER